MNPIQDPDARSQWFDWLLLSWIAGTALFYFLRFSATFYYANTDAIRALAAKFGF